ncbi:MAG: sigma factor-like helix-turn-helix DNA-binding protein [bacterium]|nr:sigma factor-like helix-turn-helix DNA-binding protein [bacterium]
MEPRTRDIVVLRFGLENEDPFTLERIGEKHGITRERVRQIVEDALENVRESIVESRVKAQVGDIFSRFEAKLREHGHLRREDLFVDHVRNNSSASHVLFFLALGDQFLRQKETDLHHPFWTIREESLKEVPDLIEELHEYFEQRKEAASLAELERVYKGSKAVALSSLLEISKRIAKTHDEQWGLKDWPHVHPKTIRDKSFLALKHTGKPLHFREVADVIRNLQARLSSKMHKNILPQTVHNELIKDKRFVLVGRGKYGLTEWGFLPGTVKEVIMEILKENGGLEKNEVIEKTLSQRHVKESTILLNLQDRATFLRDEAGRYHLKMR